MNKTFKFESIANAFEDKIYNGILVPGQKLPSVRTACLELNVSPSTIFKAYYELEAKGLIEARNKSGYYVSLSAVQQKKKNDIKSDAIISENSIKNAKNVDEMIEEIELTKLNSMECDFSAATPSIKMLPIKKLQKSLRTSLLNNKQNLIRYENPNGSVELRQYILAQTFTKNQLLTIEDIIITSGCLEAIGICLDILAKSGEKILIDRSNYYNIISLLKSKNIDIETYDFSANFNASHFENTLIEKQISLCLITANFHNPSGCSLDDNTKNKIVEITSKHAIPIVEDDVYGDLYFGKSRPSTLKQFDTKGLVYYCSSFSKTLAPGFRIGYCLPGEKKQEFAKQKRLLSLGSNSVTQAALTDFMKTGRYDLTLKNLRKQLHLNMLAYGNTILNYFPSEIKFTTPEGGYVFWIAFPKSFNSYLFYKRVIEEKIIITPGEVFSSSGLFKNYIRISYSEPYNDTIEASLKRIGSLGKEFIE